MRRLFCILLVSLLTVPALAQDRIYVVTDRSSYIAGDLVYCSLFCVDEKGRQSDFSAVSYLELISADGTAAEAKIGLFNGRGAGSFRIPSRTATGNYRLVAYTARSQASPEGSRILAVFNTGSAARVTDGVNIVPEKEYSAPAIKAGIGIGDVSISVPGRLRPGREAMLIVNTADKAADLSVSIFHEDGLAPADGNNLEAFLHGSPALPGNRSGEFEGEIILAGVEGLDGADDNGDEEVTAFISTAGDPSNVYIGRRDDKGRIRFFTNNIYGDHELVCEVLTMEGHSCHINLASPFTHPEAGDLPMLTLSPSMRRALVARKASLQTQNAMPMDTLVRFLPRREDMLMTGSPRKRYHLDNYTRFPTVREICVEFVQELQFVKKDNRWRIRMSMEDGTSSRRYMQENVLVLMDGVVLTDHGMLEDFDAMLLDDIDIYPQAVAMGGIVYNGVVNFISKRNYVTALRFPENVRVVDFKGVSYPVAYTGSLPSGTQKEMRELLFWHPALDVAADTRTQISFRTPSYAGTFRIVVEGWTADGKAVRQESLFEVVE